MKKAYKFCSNLVRLSKSEKNLSFFENFMKDFAEKNHYVLDKENFTNDSVYSSRFRFE
jgi:hypothetical protein